MPNNPDEIDEILGIVRCARCGHRLDGEVECPFCSIVEQKTKKRYVLLKWVYITACFLTSPLSIYFIFRDTNLRAFEKMLALSGCLIWPGLYFFWSKF